MSEVDEEAEKTKNQRPEGPPLRKVRLVELHDILAAHGKWLESEGKEGERTDLSGANLQEAILRGANLQGAILRGAKLQGAKLDGANLQGADLVKAKLQEAELWEANLQGANLLSAYLQGAKLDGANLYEANLYRANLQEATVVGAKGLTASQVKAAKYWELAFYSDDFLKKLGLPPDHNERVKKKLAELEKEKKASGAKP